MCAQIYSVVAPYLAPPKRIPFNHITYCGRYTFHIATFVVPFTAVIANLKHRTELTKLNSTFRLAVFVSKKIKTVK